MVELDCFQVVKFYFGFVQAIKVCRSDCIRVQNVKEDVTDDVIKLTFMNKKLSKGDVTEVERDDGSGNFALVYFASYKGKHWP